MPMARGTASTERSLRWTAVLVEPTGAVNCKCKRRDASEAVVSCGWCLAAGICSRAAYLVCAATDKYDKARAHNLRTA